MDNESTVTQDLKWFQQNVKQEEREAGQFLDLIEAKAKSLEDEVEYYREAQRDLEFADMNGDLLQPYVEV